MKLSSNRTTSITSASVSTSFSTDARPSSSTTSVSSTASSSVRQSSSSIAQLLRGVLQTVKTRRKRGEREKFLRALEKSGVDFANALLLTDENNAQVPPPSRSLESNRSSTRSNVSSINSSSNTPISANRISTRHCMRRLDCIEKLQVRATVESARAGGTLVTLQLLLITSPPRGGGTQIPLQQPHFRTQELSRGEAGVVVYQGLGTIRQQRVHELTRSFDDFRKLRKMIAFCVRRGREDDDDNEERHHHNNTQNDESAPSQQCSYCSEVRLFVAQCWEQPPLLETSMLSSNCRIRKGVLASSMLHFVRLARSEPLFPPRHSVHNNRGALESGAATAVDSTGDTTDNNGASDTDQNGAPLPSPKCQAHAEIATILHDFFRLQLIVAR